MTKERLISQMEDWLQDFSEQGGEMDFDDSTFEGSASQLITHALKFLRS